MYILLIAGLMLYLTNRFFDLKNLLNPFVFFYLYQTIFCFIALSYHEIYPQKITADLETYIVVAYVLTFVGAILSRYLFQKSDISYVRFNHLVVSNSPSKSFVISGMAVFFLAALLFVYFTYKTGGIIIFGDEIENARIDKRKGAGMINVLFISFFLYGFLIVILNKRISKGIKFLFFLIAAFAMVSFGSRAPLIKLLLSSFLLIGVLKSKKYTLKKYMTIGLMAIIIIVVLGSLRTNLREGIDFLDLVMARAGWRPFVNIQNLQRIYDFFPDQHDFMNGYSYIIDLNIFLPGHNPNFGTHLKEIMNWKFEGGSITPTFLGIGYINFGKIAFILYPLVFGFIFNSIYQLLCYKKNVKNTSIIFLILFSIGIAGSLSTGILSAFIANTIFLVFTLLIHLILKQVLLKQPFRFQLE